jgi:hypothetical protein
MPNWGSGLGGAAAGAAGGSAFGPIGAAAGGLLGGIGGLFGRGKTRDKNIQNPTITPGQSDALQRILEQLGMSGGAGGNYQKSQDYLGNMLSGDPGAYEQWAAPYKTQFNEQILPGIEERYSGLGGGLGGGLGSSSGFGQAVGGAASQYGSNLAQLYAQLRQQAAQQAMGQYNHLAGLGLGTRAVETQYQPGQLGLLGNAASGFLQGAGSSAGQGAGLSISQRIADLMKGPATGTDIKTTG